MHRHHHREDEEDAPTVRMAGDQMQRWLQDLTTPVGPEPRSALPADDTAFDEGSLEEESVPYRAAAPLPEVVDTDRTEHVWIAAGAITLVGLGIAGALLL